MKTPREQEGQLKRPVIVTHSDWPSSLLSKSFRHATDATDGRQPETVKTTEQQRYLAYMVRLWQVSSDGEVTWRASLESPHTGERHGFANLETLFAFLEERTGSRPKRKEQRRDVSEPGRGA